MRRDRMSVLAVALRLLVEEIIDCIEISGNFPRLRLRFVSSKLPGYEYSAFVYEYSRNA